MIIGRTQLGTQILDAGNLLSDRWSWTLRYAQ